MTAETRRPSAFPFKAYYFCIYAGPAIVGTYLNLFFKRRGLSDSQIGLAAAVLSIVGALSPPLWGALADRLGSRRVPGVVAMLSTGLLFPLFWWIRPFYGILFLLALFGLLQAPIVPLADAATTAYTRRWEADYGRIRVWGSIGYALVLAGLGLLLPGRSHATAAALAPIFVALPLSRLVGSWYGSRLPDPEPHPGGSPAGFRQGLADAAALFLRRPLLVVSLCTILGWGAMQAYYTFFPIYLDQLHVPDDQKGLYIDIGVVAEICFLSQSGRLQKVLGPYGLFSLGLAAQALRLFLFSFRVPLWGLGIGQVAHAFTFGAFYVGCIAILSQEVPDRLRAGGQAFFSGLVMGLGAAAGAAAAGRLGHAYGLERMFREASLVAAAGFVLSLWLVFRQRAGESFR